MDKLKRRVRSLLVVARDKGATEAERATAKSLAEKLMAMNGWTERDIPERVVGRQENSLPPPEPVIVVNVSVGGYSFNFEPTTHNSFRFGF